jgi:probable phosphoglycerate mutase
MARGLLARGDDDGALQGYTTAMIYLIRHGQTEFNREHRYQGHCDSPLTPLGREQAASAGARLAALIGDPGAWRLDASPIGRAADTARIIQAATGLAEPVFDPRLAEIDMGDWDGLTYEQILEASPEARAMNRSDMLFNAHGGEGYANLAARLGAWLAEALADAQPRIAVSHGLAGRILRGLYLGLGQQDMATVDLVPQDTFFRLDGGRVERIDG